MKTKTNRFRTEINNYVQQAKCFLPVISLVMAAVLFTLASNRGQCEPTCFRDLTQPLAIEQGTNEAFTKPVALAIKENSVKSCSLTLGTNY